MGNLLKSLREARRWTHEQAAAEMGVSRGQFIKLERGERRLTADYIRQAARAFSVPEAAIIAGPQVVSVVGLVSAGGAISTEHENHLEPLFEIELPLSLADDVIGFQVVGESMFPRYDAGDIIIVSRHGEMLESLLGFEAVVKTGDPDGPGDRFFKRIIRGAAPGTFDLESYNAPPMRGVHIGWASSMIAKVPATQWRRRNGQAATAAVKRARKP